VSEPTRIPEPPHREEADDRAPGEAGPPAEERDPSVYHVSLSSFEGPLDLLLHLIQQHELDILDIPVSFVTEKYLAYLDLMRTLTIDVASEYLVMAATLTHIKSKMLLPPSPGGEDDDGIAAEEEDPRAELVRRLLEYQKYKAAGEEIGALGLLGRDVFPRGQGEEAPSGAAPFSPFGVFNLLDAFERVLKRSKVKIEHQVVFDRISITERINELVDKLKVRRSLRFEEMFDDLAEPNRFDLVITFLALLEMCRLNMTRIYQSDALAPIFVELTLHTDDVPRTEDGVVEAGAETSDDD
jgi:segregation and condensation protein A